jgi:hypothetical protein
MHIIGFAGQAGAGKNEAALGVGPAIEIAFADEVKRIAMRLFGFSEHVLWGPSYARQAVDPRTGLTCRSILQSLGDWGRFTDPDVWVRVAMQNAEAVRDLPATGYSRSIGLVALGSIPKPSYIVMPDVRFPNEAKAISRLGGKTLWVTRPLAQKTRSELTPTEQAHISEKSLDSLHCDLTLWNVGTKAELHHQVANALSVFFKRR